ncbi:hypothetical protein NST07_23735 [Paenibacillus sp. FSL L8-0340]|uniref:hypothetical protein n=1 Tax=Paenibacillus sp. FSL L8-0340 TaxID=2954685 RepID=UPI0031588430
MPDTVPLTISLLHQQLNQQLNATEFHISAKSEQSIVSSAVGCSSPLKQAGLPLVIHCTMMTRLLTLAFIPYPDPAPVKRVP